VLANEQKRQLTIDAMGEIGVVKPASLAWGHLVALAVRTARDSTLAFPGGVIWWR
jgi:hypothetical protein